MKQLKDIITILCGNCIVALSVAAFIETTGMISGGTAGIGLMLQHWAGIPMFITVSSVNILAFMVGLFALGRRFALTTLLSNIHSFLKEEIGYQIP